MEDKPLIEDKLLMDIFVPLPPLPPPHPLDSLKQLVHRRRHWHP